MTKVKLDTSIKRKEKEITEIELRKPFAGELRGTKMLDIAQLDVEAYITLLPRITTPALTEAEVAQMDPADLMTIMAETSQFFVGKSQSV